MKPKPTFDDIIKELEAQHGPITLEKKIMANGGIQVTAYRFHRYIKHLNQKLIPPEILESIPVTIDYRLNNPPCVHCGASGTELHHFAPHHLFSDAHLWPQAYLCKPCHDLWHTTIKNHK